MSNPVSPSEEPVRLGGLIITALVAVWGVIVIAAGIDSTLSGAVTAAIAAVVPLIMYFVRGRVTPTDT